MLKVKGYDIVFDKDNPNTILIYKGSKLINLIACPPIRYGCDIINIFEDNNYSHYMFNFDGLVLITTPLDRIIYYKGRMVATTMRFSGL